MANTTQTRKVRRASAQRLTQLNQTPSFKRKRTIGRNKYLTAVRTIAEERGVSFNEAREIYSQTK